MIGAPVLVDAMGGDHAPQVVLEGAARAVAAGVPVVLVGDPDLCADPSRARQVAPWIFARDVVPANAGGVEVRRLADASVRRCMLEVREGRGGSVVSCGNSGATLVTAVLDLGLLPGVERPAIVATLPRADGGSLHLLDAGASVDCRADHLVRFAALGAGWARAVGCAAPKIGLVANASEAHKGTRALREAHAALADLPGYVGFVEPHDALAGAVDVAVADGFVGNIMLKTAEGVVAMLGELFLTEVRGVPEAAEAVRGLDGVLRALRLRLDWRARGGGVLVGANAPVVIGHGRADAAAVDAAIRLAHYSSVSGLIGDLREAVQVVGASVTSEPSHGGG